MKKVMVVDDSRFIFEEMKHMLKDTDYEIVAYCQSGEDALQNYETARPDLVTMDIILPGIDGLETSRKILEKWPEACIVVVSSLAYEDTMEQAEGIGARGFVFKPFDKEKILESFQKALGGE